MGDYPNHVDREEHPEATPENIPDDVLNSAISIAINYGECPECGHQQFHPTIPGHNSSWNCDDCDYEMTIVG